MGWVLNLFLNQIGGLSGNTLPFYRAKYPQNIKTIRKNRFLLNKNQIFIQKTQNSDIFDEFKGPNLLNIKKIYLFFISGGPWGPIFYIGGPRAPFYYIGGPMGPHGPHGAPNKSIIIYKNAIKCYKIAIKCDSSLLERAFFSGVL